MVEIDKFIIKIVADYCGLPDSHISLNRITSELKLSQVRCGPSLIRYAADFFSYLSTIPLSNPWSITCEAVRESTETLRKLSYCNKVLKEQLPKKRKQLPLPDTHWLNAPRKVRREVAKVFLGYNHASNANLAIQIRGKIANNKYVEAKLLARTAE